MAPFLAQLLLPSEFLLFTVKSQELIAGINHTFNY